MSRNIVDVINQIKTVVSEEGLDTIELDSILARKEAYPDEPDDEAWRRVKNEVRHLVTNAPSFVTDVSQWTERLTKIVPIE